MGLHCLFIGLQNMSWEIPDVNNGKFLLLFTFPRRKIWQFRQYTCKNVFKLDTHYKISQDATCKVIYHCIAALRYVYTLFGKKICEGKWICCYLQGENTQRTSHSSGALYYSHLHQLSFMQHSSGAAGAAGP